MAYSSVQIPHRNELQLHIYSSAINPHPFFKILFHSSSPSKLYYADTLTIYGKCHNPQSVSIPSHIPTCFPIPSDLFFVKSLWSTNPWSNRFQSSILPSFWQSPASCTNTYHSHLSVLHQGTSLAKYISKFILILLRPQPIRLQCLVSPTPLGLVTRRAG